MRRVGQCEEYFEDEGEADISVEEDGYCKAEMNLIIFETLTSDEQMRFRRYFLWGESIAEIAEKENVTENTIEVEGLTGEYDFLFLTDTHIVVSSTKDSEQESSISLANTAPISQ